MVKKDDVLTGSGMKFMSIDVIPTVDTNGAKSLPDPSSGIL